MCFASFLWVDGCWALKRALVCFQVVRRVSACTRSFEGASVFGVSERAGEGARPTRAGPPGPGPGLSKGPQHRHTGPSPDIQIAGRHAADRHFSSFMT